MAERLSDKCPCDKCGKDKRCELSQEACEDYLKWEDDCIKKLAEYETAEEEGRLVVLPVRLEISCIRSCVKEITSMIDHTELLHRLIFGSVWLTILAKQSF